LPINRIGVIIKRGVKNAVQRNHEKRLVLEAYRYLKSDIVQGHDFLVIVLRIGSSYSERFQQLEYFFRSFNLIKSYNA
jgi:ribonuclease P protein component